MRLPERLVLLLAVLAPLACGGHDAALLRVPAVPVDAVEREVIGALLTPVADGGAAPRLATRREVALPVQVGLAGPRGETFLPGNPDDRAWLRNDAELLGPRVREAVEDLIRKSEAREHLCVLEISASLVQPVTERDLERVRRADEGGPGSYWEAFYSQYPGSGGLHGLSRVGLSDDGRVAVLWHSWSGGFLAAAARYVVLDRTEDGWRRRDVRLGPSWIS